MVYTVRVGLVSRLFVRRPCGVAVSLLVVLLAVVFVSVSFGQVVLSPGLVLSALLVKADWGLLFFVIDVGLRR
ncbi:iron ABC transporter permease, partial [Pectobacterium brasiliense]|nr:iron ABC transporter permease [Pectobacterium brasiliense]